MTTDCMRSALSPRLRAIAGNAVLTMVASSVCMKKLADTSHNSGRILSAGALGLISQPDQFRHQAVAMITLDLDYAVPDGAAGPAQFLESSGEGVQSRGRQWQAGDHRDALAAASGGLPAHPHPRRGG